MAPQGRMKAGNCPVKGLGRILGSNSVKCCWEVGEIKGKEWDIEFGDQEQTTGFGYSSEN